MIKTGEQIAIWRKDRGLSQEELQSMCGWRDGNARISSYETGRSRPTIEELMKISTALHINLKSLMFELPEAFHRQKYTAHRVITRSADMLQVYVVSTLNGLDAKNFRDADAMDLQITPPDLADENHFWVEIDDDSLSPHYSKGSRLLIVPGRPNPGTLVLAALPDKTAGIRIYRRPTPDGYALDAVNQNYAGYTVEDADRKRIAGIVALVSSPPPVF